MHHHSRAVAQHVQRRPLRADLLPLRYWPPPQVALCAGAGGVAGSGPPSSRSRAAQPLHAQLLPALPACSHLHAPGCFAEAPVRPPPACSKPGVAPCPPRNKLERARGAGSPHRPACSRPARPTCLQHGGVGLARQRRVEIHICWVGADLRSTAQHSRAQHSTTSHHTTPGVKPKLRGVSGVSGVSGVLGFWGFWGFCAARGSALPGATCGGGSTQPQPGTATLCTTLPAAANAASRRTQAGATGREERAPEAGRKERMCPCLCRQEPRQRQRLHALAVVAIPPHGRHPEAAAAAAAAAVQQMRHARASASARRRVVKQCCRAFYRAPESRGLRLPPSRRMASRAAGSSPVVHISHRQHQQVLGVVRRVAGVWLHEVPAEACKQGALQRAGALCALPAAAH